jgi:hypothetical protein
VLGAAVAGLTLVNGSRLPSAAQWLQ